jgi:hypothetical protein
MSSAVTTQGPGTHTSRGSDGRLNLSRMTWDNEKHETTGLR